MGLALEAASRSVDRYCGRQFGVVGAAAARLYTAEWNYAKTACEAMIDDVMTTTSMVVEDNDAVVAAADYQLLPLNAAGNGRPWTHIRFGSGSSIEFGQIEITALWGWTAVPDTVKNATLMQASRYFKRKDAPFGVLGAPEFGSEAGANAARLMARIDPDVAVMLNDYRRRWAVL
jgi:hypothetical protein